MRPLFLFALLLLAGPARGMTLDEFRALPDNRVAVRTSFGLRSARALSATRVELVLGMSVSDACRNPDSYRILSFQDDTYAFERFVRPTRADARTEAEAAGPVGCPFKEFRRSIVTLDLPSPLREGVTYYVIAQGTGGTVVTGGHTAQPVVYRPVQSSPLRAGGQGGDPVDLAALGLRRVEPVGAGVIMLEFGPDFSPQAGSDPAGYHVRINGQPAPVSRLGRITRVDTYIPTGWPFPAIPMHEVFLELARPFKDGDRVEVAVEPAVTTGAAAAAIDYGDRKTLSNSIKVNQVGYLPDSPTKIAYLGRWMGSFPERRAASAGRPAGTPEAAFWQALQGGTALAAPAGDSNPSLLLKEEPEFTVCDAATGRPAFTGKARLTHRSGTMDEGAFKVDHSGENVYLLDFTAFRTPGRYFLSVPGVGRSLPFAIGADVYASAFRTQAYGVFAQRCGIELKPPYSEWRRVACHRKGLLPTTQNRLEPHDLPVLAKEVDYDFVRDLAPDPALARLGADPALAARWPLDGDLKDAVAGHDLKPLGDVPAFSADKRLLPKECRVFGPTPEAGPVGARAEGLGIPTADGLTAAGWFRYEGGDNFDGVLFGFRQGANGPAKVHVATSWGVLRASAGPGSKEIAGGRLGDGKWHHVALVLAPQAGEAPQELDFYVDGRLVGKTAPAGSLAADTFCVGTISGKETAGKYLADFRIYRRALTPEELAVLGTRWGDVARTLPAYGGHHDAGDYNPRSHLDVAQTLMDAYEIAPRKFSDGQLNIPEKGNGIPDILDEAMWALRLWMGLQLPNGSVCDGTESNGDPNFVQTAELDVLGDYAYAPDAAGSFAFAGAMAQAARIWRSLGRQQEAGDFLTRARRAYEWAAANPPKGNLAPGAYSNAYLSPKAYAAAEMLLTTGEKRFRDDFAASAVWAKKADADLEVYQLYDQSRAAWAYARCTPAVADPALIKASCNAITRYVDTFIQYDGKMAYAFLRHPWSPITWGTGAQLHWAIPATWAYSLTGDEKYRSWILRSCDNTLGANPLNRSYIVGIGTRTVRAPLHNSRYSHFGEVVDGMQVNGPFERGDGYNFVETAYPKIRNDFANLYTFADCHFAIGMDEGLVRSQAEAMAIFGLMLPDGK